MFRNTPTFKKKCWPVLLCLNTNVVLACRDRPVSNTSSKELQGKKIGNHCDAYLLQKRWWGSHAVS